MRSPWARPFRTFLVVLLGAALLLAGAEIWAWWHFREAERLAGQHRFAQAYGHYAKCLHVWRWSASTHLLAGRAARRAQMYTEAEQHFTDCRKLQGHDSEKSPALALERLLLQAQMSDIREVEEVLWERVSKAAPETGLILEGMARGYMRMLRMGAALKCLRMLVDREPENADAILMLAQLLEFSEADEAYKLFRRALELDPERPEIRLGLARYLLLDNPEEARAQLEQVLARQPDNIEALIGLAQAYRALGQSDKIRPLLLAVLEKEPEHSQALGLLGALTWEAGKLAEGETLLRRAIAANPANVDAHYQLYLCLVQQPGRESEAAAQKEIHKRVETDQTRLIELSRKDMNLKPDDPNLHYEMGLIFLRNGKPEVGLRWLYNALRMDPSHQPTHQALYDYYKQIGDAKNAEQHRLYLRTEAGR